MKLAAILTCGAEHDPMAVTAWDALETATVNGARALGRKAGRVAPGYTADLILVDFDRRAEDKTTSCILITTRWRTWSTPPTALMCA